MFAIRSYQKEDLEDVLKIYQDTAWGNDVKCSHSNDPSNESLENLTENISNLVNSSLEQVLKNGYSIVAESEGRLVGFASIFLNQHYLDCLYVEKNFRRGGIAQALLTTLEEKSTQEGIDILTVESPPSLRSFFEKMGFSVVTDHCKKIKGLLFNSYIMNKEIFVHKNGVLPSEENTT